MENCLCKLAERKNLAQPRKKQEYPEEEPKDGYPPPREPVGTPTHQCAPGDCHR